MSIKSSANSNAERCIKRPCQAKQLPVSTLTGNVLTLKPSHIIAWYIDFLIQENEDRTQISKAFTLPVNLYHADDFYFLDALRKKVDLAIVKCRLFHHVIKLLLKLCMFVLVGAGPN